jgi:hypothetical protein
MNPVPAIAALESAGGRQPLTTLQALAEALTREVPPALAPSGGDVDTVRVQAPAETQAAQRPLEHLVRPALVTALHAPPSDAVRPRQMPGARHREEPRDDPDDGARDEGRQQRDAAPGEARGEEPEVAPESTHEGAPTDGSGPCWRAASDTRADRDAAPGHDRAAPQRQAPSQEAAALAAFLRTQGPAEAVTDLARGRRVLLVLPAPGAAGPWAAAQAWLIDGRRAHRFAARWWQRTPDVAWPAWRLFRDGDPLLARGLASRSGSCRLRLGTVTQRIPDPAGQAAATLAINDRQRFAQALAGQWSVVLAVAPPGSWTP